MYRSSRGSDELLFENTRYRFANNNGLGRDQELDLPSPTIIIGS